MPMDARRDGQPYQLIEKSTRADDLQTPNTLD